jgi:hypothetical protein
MEMTPINWLAGIGFGLISLLVVVKRWGKLGRLDYQIGPSMGAGLGAAALIKAAFPIYLFVRYKSLAGIDDIWLYIYGGSVAAVFVGLDLIVKAWKTESASDTEEAEG